jgi:hypothetical protein
MCNMRAITRRFNLFLAFLALAWVCGCQTSKKDKETSALRIHIESTSRSTGATETVSVLRSDPLLVTIYKEPILSEANLVEAKVIDARGGFGIQLQFDESSGLVLEQYSAANPGKHFAIFGQWSEKTTDSRWLAAPLITRRVTEGRFSFTPDLSRTNADRLVLGLNNVAKKAKKGQLK